MVAADQPDVCLWLQGDIQSLQIDFRLTPESGHSEVYAGLPLLTPSGSRLGWIDNQIQAGMMGFLCGGRGLDVWAHLNQVPYSGSPAFSSALTWRARNSGS